MLRARGGARARVARSRATRKRRRRGRGEGGGDRRAREGTTSAREPRESGYSKWNYWRLWNFALEGITSFSDVPLKIATYIGAVTSGFALLYALFLLIRTLIWGNPVPGYPSLIIVVLFLGGIQLICLGIIGEYLARTYQETKGRALYFVKGYHPATPEAADEKAD